MPLTELQTQILTHVEYEWWMFRSVFELLPVLNLESGNPVRCALLESLVIHGRNLISFFYREKKKEKKGVEQTDWNITDFASYGLVLKTKEIPKSLDEWYENANKRVAHLTTTRGNPLSEWNAECVHSALCAEFTKFRELLGEDFPIVWHKARSEKPLGTLFSGSRGFEYPPLNERELQSIKEKFGSLDTIHLLKSPPYEPTITFKRGLRSAEVDAIAKKLSDTD